MSESNYSVYLVQRHGEQGGKREVTSPVQGDGLEFYDTGVWLDRDRGRNFFPYEQIRTIREHPEGGPAESDAGTGEESESSPSDHDDSGAQEEMLEE